jgi:CRP-like cAMP-binding protein
MISQYLTVHDFELLLAHAALLHYRRGDIIVYPGGWARKPVYIVKEGLVAIYGSATNTSPFVHMLYGKHEVFPVSGLNLRPKDMPMQTGAKAETDVAVYTITHEAFEAFMASHPERKQALLNQVVDQFKIYTLRVENLEYTRTRERIAYRMLLFASRFGTIEQEVVTIPRVSGKTVASAISMSEEAVSREMARLKNMGIISYSPGKVHLLDTERLRNQIGYNVRLPFRYPEAVRQPLGDYPLTASN